MRAGHHFPSLVIIFMKKIKRQIAKTFLAKDCTTLFISSWVNVVVAISPLGQYQRNAEGIQEHTYSLTHISHVYSSLYSWDRIVCIGF